MNLILSSSHDPLLEQQEADINASSSSSSSSKLGLEVEHLSSVTVRSPELASGLHGTGFSDLIITSWRRRRRWLVTLLLNSIEILICLDLLFEVCAEALLLVTPTWAAATFTIASFPIALSTATSSIARASQSLIFCCWCGCVSWRRGLTWWYLRDGIDYYF